MSTEHRTDAEIVDLVLRGDVAAFGDLVRRYQGAVFGLAFHRVRNFADAQDIAQDAFVKAYRKLRQLDAPERFAPWLYAIAVNECRMLLRSRKATVSLMDADAVSGATRLAHAEWERHDTRAEVLRAVDALPAQSRLVIALRYLSGFSCEEIAAFLAEPLTTIEGRLARARTKLKEEMMAMVEGALTERRLPQDFADGVLRELSLTPDGWVTTANIGPDRRTMILGDAKGGKAVAMVALAMYATDCAAILNGPFEGEEALPKGRGIDSATQIMGAFGIKLDRVVLHIDGDTQCRARVDLHKGRAARTLEMRASDGLALAARLKAPIFAEEEVVQKGKVGEDGLECDPALDLVAFRDELRVLNARTLLEARAFDIGLAPEEGRSIVRYRRDPAAGRFHIEVPGSDIALLELDLAENRAPIDRLWFEGGKPEDHYATWHNGCEYRTSYALDGDTLEVRYEPVIRDERGKPA